jgi:hypothetical protein
MHIYKEKMYIYTEVYNAVPIDRGMNTNPQRLQICSGTRIYI